MNRREEINEAVIDMFLKRPHPYTLTPTSYLDLGIHFEMGAEWADENPRQEQLELISRYESTVLKLIARVECLTGALEYISHMYPDEAESEAPRMAREALEEK